MRLSRKLKKLAKARRSAALRAITLRARWEILSVQAQPLAMIEWPAAIAAKTIRCASIAMCARQDFDYTARKKLIEWVRPRPSPVTYGIDFGAGESVAILSNLGVTQSQIRTIKFLPRDPSMPLPNFTINGQPAITHPDNGYSN